VRGARSEEIFGRFLERKIPGIFKIMMRRSRSLQSKCVIRILTTISIFCTIDELTAQIKETGDGRQKSAVWTAERQRLIRRIGYPWKERRQEGRNLENQIEIEFGFLNQIENRIKLKIGDELQRQGLFVVFCKVIGYG
jgi:hypothetical protein